MNTATKDLSYFQQQVAEKYYCENWDQLRLNIDLREEGMPYSLTQAIKEAAEAYAAYRFEQGKQEAIKLHNESIASSWEKGFKAGKQEGEAKAESNEICLRRCWDSTIQERDDLKNQVNALSAVKKGLEKSLKDSQKESWNEALLWAYEQASNMKSILNGLKQEEE